MHPKPSAFTPRQMELVQTFADQAVIAIENVRLFDEVQRTRDLEALERQTATADILKVIASSPTDVRPVFEAIAASANTLMRRLLRNSIAARCATAIHLAAFSPDGPSHGRSPYCSQFSPAAGRPRPSFAVVRDGDPHP